METSLSFHKRYLNSNNRLVIKLTVIVFCIITQVSCATLGDQMATDHLIRHYENKRTNRHFLEQSNDERLSTTTDTGTFLLQSLCSEKLIGIYQNKIVANFSGSGMDDRVKIEFQRKEGSADMYSIRRSQSHKYVCFSRRGKLKIQNKLSRDERCLFRLLPRLQSVGSSQLSKLQSDNRIIRIQSVANPKWYIGFRRNGKPLKGYHYQLKRKVCFHLIQSRPSRNEDLSHSRKPAFINSANDLRGRSIT